MSSAPCGFTEGGGFAGILGPPQVAENCAANNRRLRKTLLRRRLPHCLRNGRAHPRADYDWLSPASCTSMRKSLRFEMILAGNSVGLQGQKIKL
jgi:hypothetical protein